MKTINKFLVTMLALCGLAACGNNDDSQSSAGQSTPETSTPQVTTGDWDAQTKADMQLYLGEVLPYFELGENFGYEFYEDDYGDIIFYAGGLSTKDYTSEVGSLVETAGFEYDDEYYDYDYECYSTFYVKETAKGELVFEIDYYSVEVWGDESGNEVYAWLESSDYDDNDDDYGYDYSDATDWTDSDKQYMRMYFGEELPFFKLGEYFTAYFDEDEYDTYFVAYDYDTTDYTSNVVAVFEDAGYEYYDSFYDDDYGCSTTSYTKEVADGVLWLEIDFYSYEDWGDWCGNYVYVWLETDDYNYEGADGEFDFTFMPASESSASRVVFQAGNSTITLEQGSNTNTPANNGLPTDKGELRVYGGHILTFSTLEGSIDTIVITYSSVSGDKFKLEESIVTGGTVVYGAHEIVITANTNVTEVSMQMGGTSGHIKITSVVISYK